MTNTDFDTDTAEADDAAKTAPLEEALARAAEDQVALRAAGAGAGAGDDNDVDYFRFRIGTTWLAVEPSRVEAVVQLGAEDPVPFAPPYVRGVRVHAGRVLAVVDLVAFLGLANGAARSGAGASVDAFGRVLVLRSGALSAGVACDRVAGVMPVSRAAQRPPATLQGEQLRKFLVAELDLEDSVCGVLDVAALLDAARVRG